MAIFHNAEVFVNHAQHVQQLAFVFMNAFHLHIEHRCRIKVNPGAGSDQSGQAALVGLLHGHEFLL